MLHDADWKTLSFAILWTFEAVAAADDKVDGREEKVLHSAVLRWSKSVDPVLSRAASPLLMSYDATREEYHADRRSIDAGIAEALGILARELPAARDGFCRELFAMATDVAAASGGVLGFGNKISTSEAARLDKLRELLRAT